MASSSNRVFPSPPTSWPLPPPPPSPPSAPSFLFELNFKEAHSLHQALRILVLTATSPDGTTDSGNFYINSTGGIYFVARNIIPPYVDTCLALGRDVTGCVNVRDGLVMRLDLRRLVEEMARTIGDRKGLTLILKGQNEREIVYSLKQAENDTPLHSSVIPVIATYMGHPEEMGLYWFAFFGGFILSIDMPSALLINAIAANESPVRLTVAKYGIAFRLGNRMFALRESIHHRVVHCTRPFPLRTPYISFHPRAAILNAVALSPPTVRFHLSSDSRCVLQIKVVKVGSIYFCFNAH